MMMNLERIADLLIYQDTLREPLVTTRWVIFLLD